MIVDTSPVSESYRNTLSHLRDTHTKTVIITLVPWWEADRLTYSLRNATNEMVEIRQATMLEF